MEERMTGPRSLVRKAITIALAAVIGGVSLLSATPAGAQEMEQPAEPQPLITVRQGPAVPPGGPPPDMQLPPIPARYSEPAGPFTMYMEAIIGAGPSAYGLFAAPGCTVSGVFKRGMKLVWRFELYDMATGLRLTDQQGAQATISLPDGTTTPAMFAPRGEPGTIAPDSPWTWVAVWHIPTDYPLGPVGYTVNVTTTDGRTGALNPIAWGSPFPMIVD
jgi:hypothetical protein